eukprot:TRINITY_DN9800_c1_g1_i1.p2 TRINITY_DN9800_c1_g1~~TRINITY_DN9800_c1_g1_i1.p2  ORF type:complete len:127 (-),score=3.89 TRINITY_DN9800_c1_g1_i1:86-466(-)
MRRLSRLFSLVLLTVWLPVTQHCNLEAAGLIGKSHPAGSVPGKSETIDGCDLVKNSGFGAKEMKVPAPVRLACACLLCVQDLPMPDSGRDAVLSTEAADRPLNWVTEWHFVRRAAPPSRAPTVLCA